MTRSLLPFLALIPAAPAYAQDILVTGRALPKAMGDAAYDRVTIERDRITTTASGRIEDVLRDVAGLSQFRRSDARSANATSQGATLRGLGGNASSRALLVLDGVPQSDPFGGWITWPAYQPDRLGQVRVTRGGGSGVYGAGALAGTIEFDSIDSAVQGLGASLVYGSRQSVEASALLAGKLGAGFGFISGSYARSDGFIPIVAGQRGSVDRPAPYEQATLSARGIAPLGAQTELQASLMGFTDRRERGTPFSENGGDGADASLRLVHRGTWGVEALGYVQLRKFTSRAVAINALRTTATPSVDQFNVPSTGLGGRLEVRPPLGEGLELRLGADWRRTQGETNELYTYVAGLPTRQREAGGTSDTAGAYAELSGQWAGLTLTSGVRADHWWIRNGRLIERTIATGALLRDDRAPHRTGWEPTARGGFAYELPGATLRGAAYLGWRLPTLNELYRPFRLGADATAANPALAPERMRGAELGVDVRPAPGLSLRATGFVNDLRKAIGNVTLATGPGSFPGVGFVAGAYRQRLNLDAVRSTGLELDAALVRGDWSFGASYALTRAQIHASGSAVRLDGLRPAQVPRHMASATLGWKTLSITPRYVSAQFEDDANSRRLRDAVTVDAMARLPLSRQLSLIVRGENLGNAIVDTAISATGVRERATPRTLWLGLRIN
jgi:outer membrane receptor protein involved in Fe transport